MNVLDVLAYGTSLGLGSPQQQRDNVFRQSELDQRKMLAQSELERRKSEDAIQAKRWDAQNAPIPEGIVNASRGIFEEAGLPGLTGPVPKEVYDRMLQLVGVLGKQEPFAQYNPDTGDLLGETKRNTPMLIPGTGSPQQSIAPVAPEDIVMGPTGEPRTMTIPATPQQTARTMPMNRYLTWRDRKRQDAKETRDASEQERKAGIDTQKAAAITAASQDVAKGVEPTTAYYKHNLRVHGVNFGDWAKQELQTPSRENTDQAYARLKTQDPETLTQPEQNFIAQHEKEKLHAGKTPDPTGDKIKAMRLQIMEEKEKARKAAEVAGNTFDRVLAGEQVSVKEREVAIKELEKSNGLLLREIDLAPPEETAGLQRERAENRKRITYLRDYVEPKTRGNTPVGPVQTLKEVPTPSFNPKDLAAARDTTVRDLFGTSARWGALSTTQKRQVLDKLNAATEE